VVVVRHQSLLYVKSLDFDGSLDTQQPDPLVTDLLRLDDARLSTREPRDHISHFPTPLHLSCVLKINNGFYSGT